VSTAGESGLHRLVIFAGNVRPNATEADQSANIARTTILSAFYREVLLPKQDKQKQAMKEKFETMADKVDRILHEMGTEGWRRDGGPPR
jgi:hypothetical protein